MKRGFLPFILLAALLFGAGVALPVSANAAAIGGPGLRAAAVDVGLLRDVGAGGRSHMLPAGVVLVQYNGNGGGGGGGGYNGGGGGYAPQGGGGYNRPYNGNGGYAPQGGGGYNRPYNGNGGNSFNTGAAILGIMSAIARHHQLEEQQKQQRQYNIQLYNNQLQKRREQVEHQRKFDLEKAKLEEQRQEQLDDIKKQLNDERKARLNQPQPNTPQPNPLYPPQPNPPAPTVENDPYHDGPYHDRVGDIVINIIPAPDNCPDNFQELRVGATVLYPRRTDFPANPSLCAGTTGKGCYLKVESTPATCGGSRQVCVERCPTPLPPAAPPKVVDIRPYVPPTPLPPPTPVVIPPPPPYQPPPVTCNGGNCAPQINRACTGGNCGQQYDSSQKPTKQASLTVKSNDYVEPDHPKPTKQASLTVKSNDYVEPDHPKPTKQASLTVKSNDYIEPNHSKPTKQASLTVKSNDYVEPDHPKPTKKPELTVKAHDDEAHHTTKPAGNTDVATHSGGELDSAESFDVPCPKRPYRGMTNSRRCAEKIREETEEKAKETKQYALDHPVTDSKGCTADGGLSNASLQDNSDYRALMLCITNDCKPPDQTDASFDAPSNLAKTVVTGLEKAVPSLALPEGGGAVGGLLSGVTDYLWKDKTSDALFEQMKAYVKKLVPEMIAQEHYDNLGSLLDGMRDDLGGYFADTEPRSQGQDLNKIDGVLMGDRGQFEHPDHPEEMLAYFVAFSTLHLAVLREQYLHTQKYYCEPGEDYTSDACAKQHHTYLQRLNNAVDRYTKDAQKLKDEVLDWRLKKIHVNSGQTTESIPPPQVGGWVNNNYNNTVTLDTTTAMDDFCGTSLWHGPTRVHHSWDHLVWGPTDRAQKDADARKAAATEAFGRNLDLVLRPVAHWASVTPVAAPVVVAQAAPAGGHTK